MLMTFARTLYGWFHPTIDAFLAPGLPFHLRGRMIGFQPLGLISYCLASARYIFSRPYDVEWLQVSPDRVVRVLVFQPPGCATRPKQDGPPNKLRPLHIDCHAGAFIGGCSEASAPFCERVARETGAVVVATTYRFAPRYPFPAAIDDVDAVFAYLREHAAQRYGADPNLLTVSGFSSGGNLALAAAQSIPGPVKASVTFYAAIDLRLKPSEKPRPASFPKRDPMAFMLPLYDTYAGPVRAQNLENPRLSPAVAKLENLPEDMLLVVPGIDILVHEQLTFVERLKEEASKDSKFAGRRIEALYLEKQFHGAYELPDSIIPKKLKDEAYTPGVEFIKAAHRKHGWHGA